MAAWLTACTVAEQVEAEAESEESSATNGEFAPLIDHARWSTIDATDDPLGDHRPAEVTCTIAGWYVENDKLEINTNYCNYLAISQPTLAAVTEGRKIALGFYHFNLIAPESGFAHLAIVIDGKILWEQEIAIPGAAWVYALEFEAPFGAPAGSTLVLHLHNHGQNTWTLESIAAEQT